MGKLLNICYSIKAGKSLLEKAGITDKQTVDQLSDENGYVDAKSKSEQVMDRYADSYEFSMQRGKKFILNDLYSREIFDKYGDTQEAMDKATAFSTYVYELAEYDGLLPEEQAAKIEELNKNSDPLVVKAFEEQSKKYDDFMTEYDSLSEKDRVSRAESDPDFDLMSKAYGQEKAHSKSFAENQVVKYDGVVGAAQSGLMTWKEITTAFRDVVEQKLDQLGIDTEPFNKMADMVFGEKDDTVINEMIEYDNTLNVDGFSEFKDNAIGQAISNRDASDDMTAKRVAQAKQAGVYMSDNTFADKSAEKTDDVQAGM